MVAVRLLVADDHPVVREGLTAMLGTQPDFEVVATAGSGEEAVHLVDALAPDVLLLDLQMPGVSGVDVLRRLRALGSPTRVVVFTAYDTDERIIEAIREGADGYLLKGASREEIFSAIRLLHRGGSLLQPVVASTLLRHISRSRPSGVLSPRETQVLRLLSRGLQNKEIASELSITERTAKFHVQSILRKLGATNRTEAAAFAAERGLVDLQSR